MAGRAQADLADLAAAVAVIQTEHQFSGHFVLPAQAAADLFG